MPDHGECFKHFKTGSALQGACRMMQNASTDLGGYQRFLTFISIDNRDHKSAPCDWGLTTTALLKAGLKTVVNQVVQISWHLLIMQDTTIYSSGRPLRSMAVSWWTTVHVKCMSIPLHSGNNTRKIQAQKNLHSWDQKEFLEKQLSQPWKIKNKLWKMWQLSYILGKNISYTIGFFILL